MDLHRLADGMNECHHDLPLDQCSFCLGLSEVPEANWDKKDYVKMLNDRLDAESEYMPTLDDHPPFRDEVLDLLILGPATSAGRVTTRR